MAQDATSAAEGATQARRRGGRPRGSGGRKVRQLSEMRTAEDNQATRRRRARVIAEPVAPTTTPYAEPFALGKQIQEDAIPYAQVWLQQMLEIASILRAAPNDILQCRTFADVVEAQRRTVFACADCWFDGLQDTATQVDRVMRRQAAQARRRPPTAAA